MESTEVKHMESIKLNSEQQQLVSKNVLFARSQTKKFIKSWALPWSLEEGLFHESILGMCQAASRFNPKAGVKFITYAQSWIFLYLRKGYYQIVDTIKIPRRGQPAEQQRVDSNEDFFELMAIESVSAELSVDMSRIKSQTTQYLKSMGVRERNINWYFELLEGDLNQVEIAQKAGVNKNTVKNAMYEIRDLLLEWGNQMKQAA